MKPGGNYEVVDKKIVGNVRLMSLREIPAEEVKGRPKNMDMLGITGVSLGAAAAATQTKSKEQ